MAKEDSELQTRTCRACARDYSYPTLRSHATRFYCESCMELSAEVRATFEHTNKRLKKMASQIAKLEKKLADKG